MKKTEMKPLETLAYEEAFAGLEAVVTALEAGEQPLQEALDLFERGQGLARRCAELLEQAGLKVRTLVGAAPEADGAPEEDEAAQ